MGSEEIIKTAFAKEPHGNFVTLPGVVSRKKQIVPGLSLVGCLLCVSSIAAT